MWHLLPLPLAGAIALSIVAPVRAESHVSSAAAATSLSATSRLRVAVQVPKVLYLRIGDAGALVNTVTLTVGLSAASGLMPLPRNNVVFAGTVPIAQGTTTRADDNGTSNGQIATQLWTNNGSVTLNCSGAPLTAGALTIPLTRVTVSSSGTAFRHPGANLGACAPVVRGTSGVNNLTSNWTYSFSATGGLPAAGHYTTQITYTASQP